MSELPNKEKAYVLATAAYNEEAHYLERLVGSVVSQTVGPKKWTIVSDGSTDGTDEIAQRYDLARPHDAPTRLRILTSGSRSGRKIISTASVRQNLAAWQTWLRR